MNQKIFDRMVTNGIYAIFQSILDDPKLSKERNSLLKNSMVEISGCGSVSLYIDNSYLPIADMGPRVKDVSPKTIFAVLRTPIVDITISNGATYDISYKPASMHGKLPSEVDLELVLEEVNRVALTDNTFDSLLAMRSPKFSKPKKDDRPLDWRGMGRGLNRIDRAKITVETIDGRRLELEPQMVEMTEQIEPAFGQITTWGGNAAALGNVNISRDRVIEIKAHMGRF